MKRLNPTTCVAFKKGDTREDGRIFWAYTKFLKKDGFFAEDWRSLEKFEAAMSASKSAIKQWKIANRPKVNAYWAKRNAQKLKATPPWLTKDMFLEMESIYAMAVNCSQRTGVSHQVDHIIPLQGESVCGLHVPWNLQVLTASENASKKNRCLV